MNTASIIVVICLVGTTLASNVTFSCVDGSAPNYIDAKVLINDVECTTSPCALPRGSTVAGYLTFTAKSTTTAIKELVNVRVGGTDITLPYPIPNGEKGCDHLQDGSYCPLDKNERSTLKLEMPILEIYPLVSLVLDLFLEDQDGTQLACLRLPATVVNA